MSYVKIRPGDKIIWNNERYGNMKNGSIYIVIDISYWTSISTWIISVFDDCNALTLYPIYRFKVPYELYCKNIGIE